ncbi:efflux RND transporter permease subunit [Pelagicoccus sp. SDUM812005]|uniref:efflux RND transporter permease subunit n=1 Tax=Pelagicoccus sp. SDUM812005 TaxID=3041257 RepID=UPI00280E4E5C|nr:efflux RND transporter permease subunit [Pelagicoccus sp. SDUM812005]MDQ8179683.1 efflux RND transporter permease subunit [Pelagicoccus sp. SDUM812005]
MDTKKYGFAGKLAAMFIESKLTPLAVVASLLLGVFAVLMLPREEEPQIKVPMIDVMVGMPGASPAEVENRVTRPMEQLLWEIPDVEYLYSTSSPGGAMVIVRFKVGTDLEAALVRLNQKLQTNFDRIPQGVTPPLVKPRGIDDVPVLALTFHSKAYDHLTLRRVAAQVMDEVKPISEVAETTLIGGAKRQVRVQLDLQALASRNLSASYLVPMLQQANVQSHAGSLASANTETLLQTGSFFEDAEDVGRVVVGVWQGTPIYLRDVATIVDAAEEPSNYVIYGSGDGLEEAAVTLSIAKRAGANAVDVVSEVLRKVDTLKGNLIPADIEVSVTRDYGATASEKSNELLLHMGIAVFGVAVLILMFLGWRESMVVLLAIPVTLGLTLLVFYLYGYTLNRITLFALIFSIGILVDDAIVVVENVVRHMGLASSRKKSLVEISVEAVDEVGNPTILATWAVIAAVLPMAFVSGLMGPYMRPIPIGSSAAMLFSLLVAFVVTPWAAAKALRSHHGKSAAKGNEFADVGPHAEVGDDDTMPDTFFTRLYAGVMRPLLEHRSWRWAFLLVVAGLTVGSMALVGIGAVKVKMLPFDNKSEFQVIIDTPEGTTLEQSARIAREMAAALRNEPEVRDYQIYVGTASPFNFNGLVRHYFMRRGPNVADIQVNLLPKHEREAQSHDIAKRIRPKLSTIAEKYGASFAVAEVPPGPPVLQTLVAEIYGPSTGDRLKLAEAVKAIFESTEGVVDVDWYVEAQQPKTVLALDEEKAALHGITEAAVARAIQLGSLGYPVGLLHDEAEREDVAIVLELPPEDRARADDLLALELRSEMNPMGPLVPLRELVTIEERIGERNIYHKNLMNVTYVTADVAGATESPVYAILEMNEKLAKLKGADFGGTEESVTVYNASMPFSDLQPSMKWDGEWQVTIEVFRDLGLAFGAVLILIYMLMVGWFKNYTTPLIVMTVIPFSLVGIMPAHWGMGAFFSATSMIGFMAGAGIVVRNSIILVDFIELRLSHGRSLAQACVESGAVRFRPMMLTALAVVVGGVVILTDPIFQGLAISLLFGAVASLLISPLAVPLIYYMGHAKRSQA